MFFKCLLTRTLSLKKTQQQKQASKKGQDFHNLIPALFCCGPFTLPTEIFIHHGKYFLSSVAFGLYLNLVFRGGCLGQDWRAGVHVVEAPQQLCGSYKMFFQYNKILWVCVQLIFIGPRVAVKWKLGHDAVIFWYFGSAVGMIKGGAEGPKWGTIFLRKGRLEKKTNTSKTTNSNLYRKSWGFFRAKEESLILPTVAYLGQLVSARGSVITNHLNLVAFYTCSVREITAHPNNMLAEYTIPKGTFLPYNSSTVVSSKVLLPNQDSSFVLVQTQLLLRASCFPQIVVQVHECYARSPSSSDVTNLRAVLLQNWVWCSLSRWLVFFFGDSMEKAALFFSTVFLYPKNCAVPSMWALVSFRN